MAPTTLIGQKTTTSPNGRTAKDSGYPLKMSEMVSILQGVAYVERTAVNTPARVRKTKAALLKAFKYQKEGRGTTFIEILSNCPSNWKKTAVESNKWIDDQMVPYFPLGVFKDVT